MMINVVTCKYITHTNYHISTDHAVVILCNDEEGWFICNLYVEESHRGKGIASKLLDKCDEILGGNPVSIYVKSDAKDWLIQWYHRRGYNVLPSSDNN